IPTLLVATAVNLVVSLAATWLVGLPGPLVGTLAGVLGVSIWRLPLLLGKHFGTRPGPLLPAAGRPLLLAAPPALGLYVFDLQRPPSNWVELVAAMALTSLLYLAASWVFLFSRRRRKAWQERVRGLLGRRAAA